MRDLYILRNQSAVVSFVERNIFLSDILIGAYYNVQGQFGKDTPIRLEVFSSPVDMGQEHLRMMIRTHLSVDEALDRLTELYEGWFGGILPATHGKLLIDIEPV